MAKVDNKHPEYLTFRPEWETMRHVEAGATKVKEQGNVYLPMPSGFRAQEDRGVEMYLSYITRAEFPDIVNPTLQGMVGLIHRKEPEIAMPKSMEPIWENASPDGLSLEALFRRITTEVMMMGRFILLADASSNGSPVPWLACYNAETLINWSEDRTFFVLDESGLRREGFDWRQVKAYRELAIENGNYVVRKYGDELERLSSITPSGRGDKALTEIPLVIIGPTDLAVAPVLPPLLGVARAAIATYRLDADYRHQLFMSGQETLFITGVDDNTKMPQYVGAGVMIGLPEGCTAEYVSPTCKGIDAHRQAIQDERQNAVAAGARMFDEQRPDRESGKAKGIRYTAEMATLASVSISSAAGLEKALRYIAIMMGEDPETVIVKPNLDFFDTTLLPQDVQNLVKSWIDGGISYKTLHENLLRGGIANPDRAVAEEKALIDAEQKARAEEAAKVAEASKPDPGNGPGNTPPSGV